MPFPAKIGSCPRTAPTAGGVAATCRAGDDMKKNTTKQKFVNPNQIAIQLGSKPDWFVYSLCDPRVENSILRVRYIGVTRQKLLKRYNAHINNAKRGLRTHKYDWIRLLIGLGLLPVVEVIDPGTIERGWDRNEVAWISHFRSLGCPLTNATAGGDGVKNPSTETRAKMSASAKARPPMSEATRAKHAEQMRERMADPAYKSKMIARNTGRKDTRETRAIKAERTRAWMNDPAIREAQRENGRRGSAVAIANRRALERIAAERQGLTLEAARSGQTSLLEGLR